MESKERPKELAEYIERWNGGVFEVMAYSGRLKARNDFNHYSRCLVLPLPPDFNWSKIDVSFRINHFPNSIVITEDVVRRKGKGKKRVRPLSAFLKSPGRTSILEVTFTEKVGPKSKVWLSEKKFMEITKRNLYVDKFYAEQIYGKGKTNSVI